MLQTVLKNNKGLTLVEVSIALVVLLLVFLALMQTALLSIDSNMKNVLRDEAVNIAEEQMNAAKNTAFDDLAATEVLSPMDVSPPPRSLRNIAAFTYTVTRTVTNLNTDNIQVVMTVTWDWKERTTANGNPYTHTISSILRRQ